MYFTTVNDKTLGVRGWHLAFFAVVCVLLCVCTKKTAISSSSYSAFWYYCSYCFGWAASRGLAALPNPLGEPHMTEKGTRKAAGKAREATDS